MNVFFPHFSFRCWNKAHGPKCSKIKKLMDSTNIAKMIIKRDALKET